MGKSSGEAMAGRADTVPEMEDARSSHDLEQEKDNVAGVVMTFVAEAVRGIRTRAQHPSTSTEGV
jgi:hypothetical protein